MRHVVFVIVLATNTFFSFGQKKESIALPEISSRVMDLANLLTPEQEQGIFALIMDLETRVGTKMGIATIESLNGFSIEEYTRDLANRLALRGKKADGILILFSFKDRQLRTEVSVGLEKIITNEFAGRVNQTLISPQFVAQNYSQGFYNGIKAFAERIEANKDQLGK